MAHQGIPCDAARLNLSSLLPWHSLIAWLLRRDSMLLCIALARSCPLRYLVGLLGLSIGCPALYSPCRHHRAALRHTTRHSQRTASAVAPARVLKSKRRNIYQMCINPCSGCSTRCEDCHAKGAPSRAEAVLKRGRQRKDWIAASLIRPSAIKAALSPALARPPVAQLALPHAARLRVTLRRPRPRAWAAAAVGRAVPPRCWLSCCS